MLETVINWCFYLSNKKIQILKILYPTGIDTEDVCEVYETVLPRIQMLIDSITIGYTNAEHVVETADNVAVSDLLADIPHDIETSPPDEIPVDTIDLWSKRKWVEYTRPPTPVDTVEDVNVPTPAAPKHTHIEVETLCDTGINPFVEDSKRTLDDEWKPSNIKNCTHFKKGDKVVIKGESSRLDTNWDYLVGFFDKLPEETVVRTIPGLNVKKRTALAKFYESHPNFSCHIEKRNGSNNLVKDEEVLKKDEVRVHTETNSTYESGSMQAEDHSGLTDD